MFTGIIREKGKLLDIQQGRGEVILQVGSQSVLRKLDPGDSVSVDGVCLTVSGKNKDYFTVSVTLETLRCSNLGDRSSGDLVNLELAATYSEVLGGHVVQGHVDQTGEVLSVSGEGNSKVFRVKAGLDVLRYCVLKGSIAVNGVSLTISKLESDSFEVTIIPHTNTMTNFERLEPGDRVNLEVDVLSKYVESHVKRILGMIAIILFFSSTPLFGNHFGLGPKSILVYRGLTQNGGQSQFVIRLARYRPDIFLEWESKTQQGTLHLYREAVQEARKFTLTHLFEVGVAVESKDVMTVWLSREIYRSLMQDGVAKVRLNRLSMKLHLEGEGTYTVMVDRESREIPVIHLLDSRAGSWTFHKDPQNPVLVEHFTPYYRQFLKTVSTAPGNKLRWIREPPPVK